MNDAAGNVSPPQRRNYSRNDCATGILLNRKEFLREDERTRGRRANIGQLDISLSPPSLKLRSRTFIVVSSTVRWLAFQGRIS
jgi:hypothetical protein